jgi:ABC-type phosphate transport system substrate-binding protein
MNIQTSTKKCLHCHTENESEATHCTFCGAEINQSLPTDQKTVLQVGHLFDKSELIEIFKHLLLHPRSLLALTLTLTMTVVVGIVGREWFFRQHSDEMAVAINRLAFSPAAASVSDFAKILNALQDKNSSFSPLKHPDRSETTAIKSLLKEDVNVVLSDRPANEIEKQTAKLNGFVLKQVNLGYDAVLLVGDLPEGKVPPLTPDNIAKVFSGEITSWAQLGGSDRKIVPVLLNGKDRNTIFTGLKSLNPLSVFKETPEEVLEAAAQIPGSLTYLSATEWSKASQKGLSPVPVLVDGQPVTPVAEDRAHPEVLAQDYPLRRPVMLLYREEALGYSDQGFPKPSRETVEAYNLGLALTSEKGQELLAQMGFLPLYPRKSK